MTIAESWPPRLTTSRLVLRRIELDDAEHLFEFRSDPEVQRFNGGAMVDIAEAIDLIHKLDRGAKDKTSLHWGLTVYPDNKVMGLFGLANWSQVDRRAELGYSLARGSWGLGFAREACRELVRFGFEDLSLNRIHACPILENKRSTALLEKLGFSLEGVFRQQLFLEGHFYDEAQYALLVDEYRRLDPLDQSWAR